MVYVIEGSLELEDSQGAIISLARALLAVLPEGSLAELTSQAMGSELYRAQIAHD